MFDFFFKKKSIMLPLPYKTDLHSHIIPGVDDGSPNLEKSVFLIKKMNEWGIENIIATPHRTDETFENSPEIIEPKYLELKDALKANNIDVNLNYSFEYRMDEGFIKLKDEDKLRPLKDNYILVENSFIQPLWNLDDLIFDIKLKGLRPILAHPERYVYYHRNKDIYTHLRNAECYFQVNILSFSGCYGKPIQEVSQWLLDNGMVDFISTDLHHSNHVSLIEEFLQSSAYKKLIQKIDLKNDYI